MIEFSRIGKRTSPGGRISGRLVEQGVFLRQKRLRKVDAKRVLFNHSPSSHRIQALQCDATPVSSSYLGIESRRWACLECVELGKELWRSSRFGKVRVITWYNFVNLEPKSLQRIQVPGHLIDWMDATR